MKWFKHDTDGYRSESMALILAEYGLEGYGRWMFILEMVAEKMDETGRCSLTLPVSEWTRRLRTRPEVLQKFLRSCSEVLQKSDFSATTADGSLTITIPNLLKKRDEYSRKSGQTPDSRVRVKSKSKSKSKSKEVDTEIESPKGLSPELAQAVEIWNQTKADAWPKIEKPVKALKTRFKTAKEITELLPEVIARARASNFLANKKFITLLWLVSTSEKTGNLNAKDILNGRYDNTRTLANGKGTPDKVTEAGGDSSRNFAEQTADRENRPMPKF